MRSKTVLVIAGNEDDRLIWSAVLEHYGYRPLAVRTPGAVPATAAPDLALIALDRFDASSSRLLGELREHRHLAGVPVIAVVDPDIHLSEPLRAGCAAALARPLRPRELEAEVRRLIGPATPPSN